MAQDNRPPRYTEGKGADKRVIYRASSLGMCDKAMVALSMGYDPRAFPQWFQEILDEGTRSESTIRTMYEDKLRDGWPEVKVVDVGKVLEMEILEGVWLRGSIDGMLMTQNVPTLFEAKKIRDSGWAQYLRVGVEYQNNYPMQTSAYIHMLEEELGIQPDMAFVGGHMENKGTEEEPDWQITEVDQHIYVDPPISLRAIKKRIVGLERLISETKAIGDLQCGDQRMFPCPVFYLHDEDEEETPERPSTELIEANVREYDTLEADRIKGQAAEKRQKQIKDGVTAWLKASGQENGDVCKVNLGDIDVALKYNTYPTAESYRPPGEATRVTIRITRRGTEEVAKAPSKAKPRGTKGGAPVGKTIEETMADWKPEAVERADPSQFAAVDAAPATPAVAPPTGRKLAPRK